MAMTEMTDMQPTLVDAVIVIALIGTVLSACHRGLAREMLHTVLFAAAAVGGWFFFKDTKMPETPPEMAKVLTSAAFYLGVMYVLMWGVMKFVSPFILSHHPVGVRSRFWAGALSVFKVVSCVLALNLWFAIHSPEAHPLRLEIFPEVVRESVLVKFSDRKTDDLYRWLARQNVLNYEKYVEKPKTQEKADETTVNSLLGVTAPGDEPVNSGDIKSLHKMDETPESVE